MTTAAINEKQAELKAVVEAEIPGAKANWWFGRNETRLYINTPSQKRGQEQSVYLTFDDSETLYGAKANVGNTRYTDYMLRSAFYYALKVGRPEELAAYIAECKANDLPCGGPEDDS